MLRIVNKYGQTLEIPADQTISVEKDNPLFNDPGAFCQDISYELTVPFSENNKKFFEHGQLAERSNNYYTIAANYYADEIQLAAGNILFRIAEDGFDINLEPNLTAIVQVFKNGNLTEVRTSDLDDQSGNTTDKLNALMLDTCVNPDKYNYVFVSINNTIMAPDPTLCYGMINYYDPINKVFVSQKKAGKPVWYVANTPFFKLTYILKQLVQWLGFTPKGSFLTSARYKNYLVYTQVAFDAGIIFPCMQYMPFIKISDLLKYLRDRLHIAFDFDLVTGECTMETFRSIKNSNHIFDLTPYVVAGIQQELPDQSGLNITLKVDNSDGAWKQSAGGNDIYPPTSQLIAGDGGTEVTELNIGTLKTFTEPATLLQVQQLMNNLGWFAANNSDFQRNQNFDVGSGNNWPLRLFNYLGFDQDTDEAPRAEPIELNDEDLEWYQFQNDSKRHIIPVEMPPSVLASMKNTYRYCYRTEGNNYVYLILEKITYDANPSDDLISATIYARSLNFDIVTPTAIVPSLELNVGNQPGFGFKAYFDPTISLFNSLSFQTWDADTGLQLTDVNHNPLIGNVYQPTNIKGVGGSGIFLNPLNVPNRWEIRINQGVPKFVEFIGVRSYFTNHGAYYSAIFTPPPYITVFDWVWISF